MGLVENVRLEKAWVTELVTEIGSFAGVDILTHGFAATFSWGQAHTAGHDLISRGFVPADVSIPQFLPIALRLVDRIASRDIALIYKGVIGTYSIETGARSKLLNNVSGQAISLLTESEIN